MTDKLTFPPKPGRTDPARPSPLLPKPGPRRGGFDPAALGSKGPAGPKGPKGRPIRLPSMSRGR